MEIPQAMRSIKKSRSLVLICVVFLSTALLLQIFTLRTCGPSIEAKVLDTEFYGEEKTLKNKVTSVEIKVNESLLQGLVPRSFDRWQYGHEALCQPPEEGFNYTRGLLYLKPAKTGSSTTSGINLRIARNLALRLNKTKCHASYEHHVASQTFANREPSKSFMWTILREPTRRIVSQFFHFEVSRNKVEPTDKNFQEYAYKPVSATYYLDNVAPVKEQDVVPNNTHTVMQATLDQYNFIGITERFDESVVALQMILDLPPGDLLYLEAKSSGGYDDGRFKDRCFYIVPKFISPGMKKFFKSEEWQETIKYQRALYLAANRSLDLTIDALGRQEFSQKLRHFKALRALAVEECAHKTVFPCLANGEKAPKTDCLYTDSGCGAKCLDRVVLQHQHLHYVFQQRFH